MTTKLTERETLLLRILGESDSIYWPYRGIAMIPRSVYYERRAAFLARGIPWISGALHAGDRKAVERLLGDLATAGEVILLRSPGGRKTVGIRLSDATDDAMRHLIGLSTHNESLAHLDELYRHLHADDNSFFLGQSWRGENLLTGIEWGDNANRGAYVCLTEDMYPLMWRRLVISGSTIYGHVSYALSRAGAELGRERASAGRASSEYPPTPPAKGNEKAYTYYHDARMAMVQALETAKPKLTNELGSIPLPLSRMPRPKLQAEAEAGGKENCDASEKRN